MTLELMQGLRGQGLHLEAIGTFWGEGELAGRLQADGFPVQRLWLGFISATMTLDCLWMTAEQVWRWPQALIGYRRILRRSKPERVIHLTWHHLLILWPFLSPTRDLFWLHESIPDKLQYRWVFGWIARRLRGFVAVSHAVAASLRQIGIPQEKIRVIHNGLSDPVPQGGMPLRSRA